LRRKGGTQKKTFTQSQLSKSSGGDFWGEVDTEDTCIRGARTSSLVSQTVLSEGGRGGMNERRCWARL